MKYLLLLLIPFLLYPQVTVSTCSTDSMENAVTVTVTGSGFGIKSPAAPFVFMDFEDTPVNSDTLENYWFISQARPQSSGTPYATARMRVRETDIEGVSDAHIYSNRYASGCHYEGTYPGGEATPYIGGGYQYRDCMITFYWGIDRDSVFASWTNRLTPNWPDSGYTGNVTGWIENHKYSVFQTGLTGYEGDNYYQSFGGNHYTPARMDPYVRLSGGQRECASSQTYPVTYMPNPVFQWVKQESHVYENNLREYINNLNGYDRGEDCTQNDPLGFTVGGYWRQSPAGNPPTNQMRGSSHAWRFFDDIYIDTTLARIVLGDSSTYATCSIVEPQLPTAWSNTSITFTSRLGMLDSCETVYLYVFDEEETHNTSGLAIPVGGYTPAEPPAGINLILHGFKTE